MDSIAETSAEEREPTDQERLLRSFETQSIEARAKVAGTTPRNIEINELRLARRNYFVQIMIAVDELSGFHHAQIAMAQWMHRVPPTAKGFVEAVAGQGRIMVDLEINRKLDSLVVLYRKMIDTEVKLKKMGATVE